MKKLLIAVVAFLHLPTPEADAAKAWRGQATCYTLRGTTASGTYVDKRTAAHNFLFLGTRIRIVGRQPGPMGVRKYVVRDTGPALSDGHFDLWTPSSSYCLGRYGRRPIRWKLGWGRA